MAMSQHNVGRNDSLWPQAIMPTVLDVLPVTSLSFFSFALQEFEEDVKKLRLSVDDTDRRLSAIFCQALEDAPGLEHILKVQATVVFACYSPAYKGALNFEL